MTGKTNMNMNILNKHWRFFFIFPLCGFQPTWGHWYDPGHNQSEDYVPGPGAQLSLAG